MKRGELVDQASFSRLIIVKLGQGSVFKDLKEIQTELDRRILALVPEDCVNKEQIPYLSTGQRLHNAEIVFESADG